MGEESRILRGHQRVDQVPGQLLVAHVRAVLSEEFADEGTILGIDQRGLFVADRSEFLFRGQFAEHTPAHELQQCEEGGHQHGKADEHPLQPGNALRALALLLRHAIGGIRIPGPRYS